MARSVKLSLRIDELSSLIMAVQNQKKISAKTASKQSNQSALVKSLLGKLKQTDHEELVILEIKKAIFRLRGIPVNKIKESLNLRRDLKMNTLQIRSLAFPFTRTVQLFKPKRIVLRSECENCEFVINCIELVLSKIQ